MSDRTGNKTPRDIATQLAELLVPAPDQIFDDLDKTFVELREVYSAADRRDRYATQAAWKEARAILADRRFNKYRPLDQFLDKPAKANGARHDPPS